MRTRINERIDFCLEDGIDEKKIRLLAKSDNKCAHCGKPLDKWTVEIDHAIPLDKGGSNDEVNLVALCHDCNVSKDNYVIHPVQYLKYLNKESATELLKMYRIYCEDISWLHARSLTREDKTAMRYPVQPRYLSGHLSKKNAKGETYGSAIMNEAVLTRARKDDIERIIKFLERYHEKQGLEKDYIRSAINEVFYRGCIYIVEKQDSIISVLPVMTRWVKMEGKRYWLLKYGGIPCLYQKPEYVKLIADCILYINQGLARSNARNLAVYSISFPMADQMAALIDNYLSQYGNSMEREDEDGWKESVFAQRYQEYEEQEMHKSPDYYEELQFFSDHLERIFKLNTVKEEKDSSKRQIKKSKAGNKQLQKQQRRDNREYDEYDERYYRCS